MAMSPTMASVTGMATSTSTAAASKGMSGMSGMGGMGGGDMSEANEPFLGMQMLWNWYTVDSCFISRTWRITSKGMFAGSCIGVICLVICLEGLRRAQREYDAYLVRQYHMQNIQGRPSPRESISKTGDIEANDNAKHDAHQISVIPKSSDSGYALVAKPQRLVPTVLQQAIRALIHMLQFAVAYFIMLLAMYYNGYIIICIIIGAYLGSFIFSWEGIHISDA
ncbi:MAG: hypothetical protein LQ343_002876 [Gyalolechia ehrenbergii]|nr:MAG: hypothetical protein LQ343_002876 [Gyalolechia ehrenbergii]